MHLLQMGVGGEGRGSNRGLRQNPPHVVSSVNKVVEESSEISVKCQCSADDFTLLENVWLDIDLF